MEPGSSFKETGDTLKENGENQTARPVPWRPNGVVIGKFIESSDRQTRQKDHCKVATSSEL